MKMSLMKSSVVFVAFFMDLLKAIIGNRHASKYFPSSTFSPSWAEIDCPLLQRTNTQLWTAFFLSLHRKRPCTGTLSSESDQNVYHKVEDNLITLRDFSS